MEAIPALQMPIFHERVVGGLRPRKAKDTGDAMSIAYNETGRLDFKRMASLLGRTSEEVRLELAHKRMVFKNPVGDWEPADKYLSGNVREKLKVAEAALTADSSLQANVDALRLVQPQELPPSQIHARLGAPWIPAEYVTDFINEKMDIPYWGRNRDQPYFSYVEKTGEWVKNTAIPGSQASLYSQWGTSRMGADAIMDKVLNGKQVEVSDKVDGDKSVRNPQETIAAQEKARAMQEAFQTWLWQDSDRAERLSDTYNNLFNNMRPRSFDGDHQTFPGMSSDWTQKIRPFQKDAVWRVVQDRTALLSHDVGFGKTLSMVAGGMELRRLGLAGKNMYVVPKATHAQFKDQFLDFYPYAKLLYPGPDDFTPSQRGEFLSRAATGDWDAIIVSDSQFRRIPLKPETEAKFIREEIEDFRAALEAEQDRLRGQRGPSKSATSKELQKAILRAEERLHKVYGKIGETREQAITFEDMGVDQMFVDEADMYKNLPFATRMGRIKGLPNSQSQRAFDMYSKIRTLQGGGGGVVFATGTPVANTIAELYTQMRYLQESELEKRGLQHFDAWAKTFGDTIETIEQTPTGAYRQTQRFAKFANTPELSKIWQYVADIRVADEVPLMVRQRPRIVDEQGNERRTVVTVAPDQHLLDYMQDLAARADNLKNVDPTEDNMLKISGDARMASLDVRMVRASAPENPAGKIAVASDKIAQVYRETTPDKGTQLVFLDIGTPKAIDTPEAVQEGEDEGIETSQETQVLRNVYGAIKQRLLAKGIPVQEIAFIHEATNDKKRLELFKKVNDGDIRILIGSTGKMGVGVNVQRRAAALHHLDAPWRPRDIEQREGRVIRQGNVVYGRKLDAEGNVLDQGKGVRIYTYVTEKSFDAFMWQAIEAKAKAIKSIVRRETTQRSVEDADTLTLSAAEAKALATGNPDVMKSVTLKNDISRLELLHSSYLDSRIRASQQVVSLPKDIESTRSLIDKLERDANLAQRVPEDFSMAVEGQGYAEHGKAGAALLESISKTPVTANALNPHRIGEYGGFHVFAYHGEQPGEYRIKLKSPATDLDHAVVSLIRAGDAPVGVAQKITNRVKAIPGSVIQARQRLEQSEKSLATYREQLAAPFLHQERLNTMKGDLTDVELRLQNLPSLARAA